MDQYGKPSPPNPQYYDGDVFSPNRTGHEMIICHQVNCKGVMGAGLAKQIRTMFPVVYTSYKLRCSHAHNSRDLLGEAQLVQVRYNGFEYDIANLYAQDGFGRDKCYTDYDALRKALSVVRSAATPLPLGLIWRVRIPYGMGCGLAGGSWDVVEKIINEELVEYGIPVEIWKKQRGTFV